VVQWVGHLTFNTEVTALIAGCALPIMTVAFTPYASVTKLYNLLPVSHCGRKGMVIVGLASHTSLSHHTVVWLGYIVYCVYVCVFVPLWISQRRKKVAA